jgi:hypothetical protein
MPVLTQLYFQIVEENNYMFRPFAWWAIIRLRLEYRRKFIYYNVDIKHGERDLVLQCLGRSVAIYTYVRWSVRFPKQRSKTTQAHVSMNLEKTRQIKS